MSARLSGKKKPAAAISVTVQLNDRAGPMDRGELYEDPLEAILKKKGLGEVTGGGTMLSEEGEIEFCDLEILLHDADENTLRVLTSALEELGAPKGSKLILESQDKEVPFGVNEGLAVYLNGTSLPEEVYEECDLDTVYEEFTRLLGSEGKIHGVWQGPTETALYVYGRSFAAIKDRLSSFLSSYPLCRGARVVQIA